MTVSIGSIQLACKPLVKQWHGNAYNALDPLYSKIFEMQTSDLEHETIANIHGTGMAYLKHEGAEVRYDDFQQAYSRQVKHNVYGLGMIISQEAIRYGRYLSVLEQKTRSLIWAMNQAKENVAWNIINNMTDTGSANLGGDGLPLLSTAHLLSKGGTQANRPTSGVDLSERAIEDALTAIKRFKTEEGFPFYCRPKQIIIAPENEFELQRILGSNLRVGTANNDTNVLNGILPYVSSQYISNGKNWLIQTDVPSGLVMYQAWPMELDEDKDFGTNNMRYKAIEAYSFTWGDWRCVYGSQGTS